MVAHDTRVRPPEQAEEVAAEALKVGYRHVRGVPIRSSYSY